MQNNPSVWKEDGCIGYNPRGRCVATHRSVCALLLACDFPGPAAYFQWLNRAAEAKPDGPEGAAVFGGSSRVLKKRITYDLD